MGFRRLINIHALSAYCFEAFHRSFEGHQWVDPSPDGDSLLAQIFPGAKNDLIRIDSGC